MTVASNSVVVNANGVARMIFTPAVYASSWTIDSVIVRNNGADVPTVYMYLNGEGDANLIGGTFSGNFDTDSQPNITLQSGDSLILVWEGATPNSNSVGVVNYTLDTGRS